MQQFSVCQFLDEVCELSANAQARWLRVLQEGEYERMGDTSVRHDKEVLGVTPEVVQALQACDWPGNIRELENIIERGVILAHHHGRIELADLFPSITLAPASEPAVPVLAAPPRHPGRNGQFAAGPQHFAGRVGENRLLDAAAIRSRGNLSSAARLLGMTRPQLAYP